MSNKLDMSLDDVIKMNKKKGNKTEKGPKSFSKNRTLKKFARPVNTRKIKGNYKIEKNFNAKKNTSNYTKSLEKKNRFIRKTKRYIEDGNQTSNHNNANQSKNKTTLRISNLDFNITHKDLMDLFSQFGPIIKNRIDFDDLGRSKGTATIQYEKPEAASKAILEYNGATLDGKQLIVEHAKVEKISLSGNKDSQREDEVTIEEEVEDHLREEEKRI